MATKKRKAFLKFSGLGPEQHTYAYSPSGQVLAYPRIVRDQIIDPDLIADAQGYVARGQAEIVEMDALEPEAGVPIPEPIPIPGPDPERA